MDDSQLPGMFHIAGASRKLGQNRFRHVILRRSETACRNDDIALCEFVTEIVQNLVPVIPKGDHPGDTDAGLFQG